MAQAERQRQERQVMLAAHHAHMIRAAVWAEECPDVWTLAGVPVPPDELERRRQEEALNFRLLVMETKARGGKIGSG